MKNISIGRESDNQIILPQDERISRNHATLVIDNKGMITLRDHSSNGTVVNGIKIHRSALQIQRGADVLFAGIARLDWSQVPQKRKIPVYAYFILPALLLLGLGGYQGWQLLKPTPGKVNLTGSQIDDKFKNAVGLVAHAYYIKWESAGIGTLFVGYNKRLYEGEKKLVLAVSSSQETLVPFLITGSGFLVKSPGLDGNLISNRHVSDPAWELNNNQDQTEPEVTEFIETLTNTVYTYQTKFLRIQPKIGQYKTHTYMLKFLPNESVLQIQEDGTLIEYLNKIGSTGINLERLWHHKTKEVDLALLKTTAIDTTKFHLIDLNTEVEYTPDSTHVGNPAHLIGFSGGLIYAYDQYQKAIQRTFQNGIISQPSSLFSLFYSIDTQSGASGSPVFNSHGDLIAVHYAGRGGAGYGILSKYIRDLITLKDIETAQ